MCCLQSHRVWLKLSNLSIVDSSPLVCLAAHGGSLHDGHFFKCQTSTATPAEPGELPWGFSLGQLSARLDDLERTEEALQTAEQEIAILSYYLRESSCGAQTYLGGQ